MIQNAQRPQNEPPKRILNYKQTSDKRIFYYVAWDHKKKIKEWIQDIYLVGCQQLIQDFFMTKPSKLAAERGEVYPIRPKKKAMKGQRGKKTRKRVTFSRQTIFFQKKSKLASKKNQKNQKNKKGRKKKQKKEARVVPRIRLYRRQLIGLLQKEVAKLTKHIKTRPEDRLDYLVKYPLGLFRRDGVLYFLVRTLPPVRDLFVPIQQMRRYFPQILITYIEYLLSIYTPRTYVRGQVIMEEEQSEEDSGSAIELENGNNNHEKMQAEE